MLGQQVDVLLRHALVPSQAVKTVYRHYIDEANRTISVSKQASWDTNGASERKRLPLRCSFILPTHFGKWGRVWGQSLTHNVCGVFIDKKHRKPRPSMLFGAGNVTRTHDLWLLVRSEIRIA